MRSVANNFDLERIERQSRLTGALLESAIATSAALYAVIAAVYRRSPDALAHVDRVALMAVRVGEELGLAERALDDLERAAWGHDLGKLVVPDRVSGPVDVSAGDVAQWSEQVVAASDMLRTAPFLRPAAEIVLASRECMDGTGFPRRLEGRGHPARRARPARGGHLRRAELAVRRARRVGRGRERRTRAPRGHALRSGRGRRVPAMLGHAAAARRAPGAARAAVGERMTCC